MASIGAGIYSISQWDDSTSLGTKALDAGGLALDSVAAALPFVPGGVGLGIKAARGVENAHDAANLRKIDSSHLQQGNPAGNKLKPNEIATGDHTGYSRDKNSNIFKYETYSQQPTGHWNPEKRFDGGKPDGTPGRDHLNKLTGQDIPTPHVQGKNIPGGVRPAENSEFPRNPRFTP